MSWRRPSPSRGAGAVARPGAAVLLAVLLAGCGGGKVPVDAPSLSGADARTCGDLVDALPDTVDGDLRRPVDPEDAYGAAWGEDPAIVLRCGVPRADGFDRFATCQETEGVGWFIPEDQVEAGPGEITMTTIGRSLDVEVVLPEDHYPPANAMVDLAPAIKQTVPEVDPCV